MSSTICDCPESDAVKLVKKALGEVEVETVLQRLDRLTLDEARTIAVQILEVVYDLVQNMRMVLGGEQMPLACWPRAV